MVALGANLPSAAGTPAQTLQAALDRLGDSPLQVEAISRMFATPCYPPGAGPDYVNAAALLSGAQAPGDILALLHGIEAEFARTRGTRWGMRTLDLDLIAVDDLVLPDAETHAHWRDLSLEDQRRAAPERLILPHPRLQDRAFVLIPLMDVAPDWVHPILGQSVAQMTAALPKADKIAVRAL